MGRKHLFESKHTILLVYTDNCGIGFDLGSALLMSCVASGDFLSSITKQRRCGVKIGQKLQFSVKRRQLSTDIRQTVANFRQKILWVHKISILPFKFS